MKIFVKIVQNCEECPNSSSYCGMLFCSVLDRDLLPSSYITFKKNKDPNSAVPIECSLQNIDIKDKTHD